MEEQADQVRRHIAAEVLHGMTRCRWICKELIGHMCHPVLTPRVADGELPYAVKSRDR